MYDKIDLWITNPGIICRYEADGFRVFTKNPSFVRVGNRDEDKFQLKNKKLHANQHALTVQIIRKTHGDAVAPPVLHISGSLRQWYYGALSMRDLTRYDTYLVLNRLATELDMSYAEFAELPLSSVEVGMNLDLGDIKPTEISSRMSSFKDSRYRPGSWDNNYKRFKTGKFAAKAYDKVKETKLRMKRIKANHGKERFMNDFGNKNILRLEFKAHGGPSKMIQYFRIATVGDLVMGYNRAATAWIRYTRMMRFKGVNLLRLTSEDKSLKGVSDYIWLRGLMDITDEEMQSILGELSIQVRRDVTRKIRKQREKMPDSINVKTLFQRTANRHLIEMLRESQREWIEDATVV